jgi:hypothetical protein
MKKTVLFVLLLSGCMAPLVPYTSFQPRVSPDGEHLFTFAMGEYDRSAWPSEQAAIDSFLGGHLARNQYCQKGYEITEKKRIHNNLVIQGRCR